MTDLLDRAVAAARGLPAELQDDIARIMLDYAGEDRLIVHLTAEDETSFAESLAQADRREFASDEEVRVVWEKHGL